MKQLIYEHDRIEHRLEHPTLAAPRSKKNKKYAKTNEVLLKVLEDYDVYYDNFEFLDDVNKAFE